MKIKGMSILEVVIAMGLFAGVSVGMMKMMQKQVQMNVQASGDNEIDLVMREVALIYTNMNLCSAQFDNTFDLSTSTNFASGKVTKVVRGTGSSQSDLYYAGKEIKGGKIKIKAVKAYQTGGWKASERNIFMVVFQFEKSGMKSIGSRVTTRRIKVAVEVDDNKKFTNCVTYDDQLAEGILEKACAGNNGTFSVDATGVAKCDMGSEISSKACAALGLTAVNGVCNVNKEICETLLGGTLESNGECAIGSEICPVLGLGYQSGRGCVQMPKLSNCTWTDNHCFLNDFSCGTNGVITGFGTNGGDREECWGHGDDYDEANRRVRCCRIDNTYASGGTTYATSSGSNCKAEHSSPEMIAYGFSGIPNDDDDKEHCWGEGDDFDEPNRTIKGQQYYMNDHTAENPRRIKMGNDCGWTEWKCESDMTCPAGRIMKAIEAQSSSKEGCSGGGDDFDEPYRRIYCCGITVY